MKTRKGWDKSNIDLDKYLNEPCEIDEELYNYIAEVVMPNYHMNGLIQGGDAIDTDENEVLTYQTVLYVNNKYFYIGILPEFKDEAD